MAVKWRQSEIVFIGPSTSIIINNFQSIGKYESIKTRLNKCVRWMVGFFGSHLATSVVI